jgi:hypothetical protein
LCENELLLLGVRTKNWLLVLLGHAEWSTLINSSCLWLPSCGKRRSFKTPSLANFAGVSTAETGRLMNPSFKRYRRQPLSTKLCQEPEQRACWSTRDLQLSVSLRPSICWDVYVLRASSPVVLSMRSCTVEIRWTKSNICRFHSGKRFWLSRIAQFAVAGKRRSGAVHLQKRV